LAGPDAGAGGVGRVDTAQFSQLRGGYVGTQGCRPIARARRSCLEGVQSVVRIYNHYKKFDYKTQVMGASFRKVEQVMLLAGCDLLTISPDILTDLEKREGELPRRLSGALAKASDATPLHLDEKTCRFMHNQDAMAVDKLSDGIRHFYADARKLEAWASQFLAQGA
jgi:transaldolase